MNIYDAYQRRAGAMADCVHGLPGGDLVRPWCRTPACSLCRRRHPVHWVPWEQSTAPTPDNVVKMHERKLF